MSSISASSLFDAFEDLYFVFDETGRLQEWNECTAALADLIDEDLSEATPADLFEGDAAARVAEAVETAVETGAASVEVRQSTDAGTVPYEVELRRLDGEASGAARFVGVGRDISIRETYRERTSRRQQVLQRVYDVIADSGRPFESQVSSLLELGRDELGVAYGTLSEIRGEDYHFRVVAADDDSIQAGDVAPVSATNCELVASERQTIVLGDVAREAPEQTDRAGYAEWGISCYIGAPVIVDDDVYGTFCFYDTEPRSDGFTEWEVTLVDLMSRWVSYELQNRRAKARLQRQNDKLERFASIVSHDLRNPLNVLSGTIQIAQETGELEHLERAREAIDRMDTLIGDLLTLSRAGKTIDGTEPVDLASLVDSCWSTVVVSGGTIRVETDRVVHADRTRLQQLIENLLGNAIDHGGEDVTVTVGDLSEGFYVEDDGPGIPESERGDVFTSGYTTHPDGTGFGLAIVEEVAEAHGWDVSVTEGVDGGARFEFTGVSGGVRGGEKSEG